MIAAVVGRACGCVGWGRRKERDGGRRPGPCPRSPSLRPQPRPSFELARNLVLIPSLAPVVLRSVQFQSHLRFAEMVFGYILVGLVFCYYNKTQASTMHNRHRNSAKISSPLAVAVATGGVSITAVTMGTTRCATWRGDWVWGWPSSGAGRERHDTARQATDASARNPLCTSTSSSLLARV